MRTDARSSGFTLVENIVALGLLAVVLVSIGGLATVARRAVESGRTSSAALGAARGMLDELCGSSFEGTWRELGLDGSTAIARLDTRTAPWGAGWQAILVRSLARPHAEIELTTIAPGRATPLDAAEAIRVVVTVHWTEGPRARRLRLVTVRA